MSETIPITSTPEDFPVQESSPYSELKFNHVNDMGKPANLPPEIIEDSQNAILGFRQDLDNALQELPNHIENLQTDRIDGFLKNLGVEPSGYHVIAEDDFPHLGELYKQTMVEHGIGSLYRSDNFQPTKNTKKGWHDPLSGQTFIVRRYLPEIENGPEFTESIIVHELFHAASAHRDFIIVHGDRGEIVRAGISRVGLLLPDNEIPFAKGRKAPGYFLEEAAASYFEGQYKKEFKPSKLMAIKDPNRNVGVPYEYARFEGGKVVQQNGYGPAGYAMDLMIEARPDLLAAVVESRGSEQGLKDVARIINDIKPGLYSALSRINPTEFHEENLEMVRRAVNGDADGGHPHLRSLGNPEGHVLEGFVGHRDRITHKAAVPPRSTKKKPGLFPEGVLKL